MTLLSLCGVFAGLYILQLMVGSRAEVLFWGAILMVRAAATVLADYSIAGAHLGYALATAALALLLVIFLAATGGLAGSFGAGQKATPQIGLPFWICMLVAGTLGTVIADGIGHQFGNVRIGVPAAAAIETLLLILALWSRQRLGWPLWSYWIGLVVVRAWGTSVGDITKALFSLPVSLSVSGVTLLLIVLLWRPARTSQSRR